MDFEILNLTEKLSKMSPAAISQRMKKLRAEIDNSESGASSIAIIELQILTVRLLSDQGEDFHQLTNPNP